MRQVQLERLHDAYIKHNASKNVFAAVRTPATLFAVAAVFYLLAGVAGMVGFELLANILNLAMFAVVGVIAVWVYARMTGKHANMGVTIDSIVGTIHNVRMTVSSYSFYFERNECCFSCGRHDKCYDSLFSFTSPFSALVQVGRFPHDLRPPSVSVLC